MDYEKKYREALERAKDLHDKHALGKPFIYKTCEDIFPELKESEDKQSKEWILEYLYDGLRKSDEQFKGQFKAAIAWLEKQGESKEKPIKDQVWDYCNKISSEWWQITMGKWNTLTDEEKNKYNQFVGFNDFSDTLMNITAGALFQLIDTGKLEYEEGNLLLEKPDDTSKPLEVINEKQGEHKPIDEVKPKLKMEITRKNRNVSPLLYGVIDSKKREALLKRLEELYNTLGIDTELNTPDYLLAEYTLNCLVSYGNAVTKNIEKTIRL